MSGAAFGQPLFYRQRSAKGADFAPKDLATGGLKWYNEYREYGVWKGVIG